MFKELIDKLKQRRNKIQNYRTNNEEIKTGIKVHEEKQVEIIVSSQNNITKIEQELKDVPFKIIISETLE